MEKSQTTRDPAARYCAEGYRLFVAGNYAAAQVAWQRAAAIDGQHAAVTARGVATPSAEPLSPELLAALAPPGYQRLNVPDYARTAQSPLLATRDAQGQDPGNSTTPSAADLVTAKRRQVLHDAALALQGQVNAGQVTALEAFARLTELAAANFPTQAVPLTTFIDDLSSVILGRIGSKSYDELQKPAEPYFLPWGFGGSGFRLSYQDPEGPKTDQVHHIWFYTHITVWNGFYFALATNTYHETWPDQYGRSLAEWLLGIPGAELGALLKTGAFRWNAVGNWLRRNLGPQVGDA